MTDDPGMAPEDLPSVSVVGTVTAVVLVPLPTGPAPAPASQRVALLAALGAVLGGLGAVLAPLVTYLVTHDDDPRPQIIIVDPEGREVTPR